jgi:hypothetical protein
MESNMNAVSVRKYRRRRGGRVRGRGGELESWRAGELERRGGGRGGGLRLERGLSWWWGGRDRDKKKRAGMVVGCMHAARPTANFSSHLRAGHVPLHAVRSIYLYNTIFPIRPRRYESKLTAPASPRSSNTRALYSSRPSDCKWSRPRSARADCPPYSHLPSIPPASG